MWTVFLSIERVMHSWWRWAAKVYLEHSYHLQGFFEVRTMQTHRYPGMGYVVAVRDALHRVSNISANLAAWSLKPLAWHPYDVLNFLPPYLMVSFRF